MSVGKIGHPETGPLILETPHDLSKPEIPHPEVELSSDKKFEGCEIKRELLNFVNDGQWMAFINDLFALATNICSLMSETEATEFIPYLSILSSPITLHHAVKGAIQRFKLMVSAFKTSRIADSVFWALGSVNSVGSTISDILKPIVGGVTLFGVGSIPAVQTAFSFVIPIVLITFSVIGGVHKGWSLGKVELALHHFQQRKKGILSLKEIEKLLIEMKGPQKESLSDHDFQLDSQEFDSCYFTSEKRKEAIQSKIDQFLNQKQNAKVEAAQQSLAHISHKFSKEIDPLSTEIVSQYGKDSVEATRPCYVGSQDQMTECSSSPRIFEKCGLARMLELINRQRQRIMSSEGSLYETIDATLIDCEQAIQIAQKNSIDTSELEESWEELKKLKREYRRQGFEILHTIKSELDRKILQKNVSILCFFIGMTSSLLFLVAPQSNTLPTALSLSATAISILMMIFDKSVSQKKFLQIYS